MKEDKKVALYTLLILVVVFLELLFFNYRTWQSQSYQEVPYPIDVIRTENIQAFEGGYCDRRRRDRALYPAWVG